MMLDVTTEIPLDNETRTALLLFNERLDARALQERGKKRVAKAERAKDAAAATVRKVGENPDATAEEKAEAEATYKAALDEYNVIAANPTAGLDEPKKKKSETPASDDSTSNDAAADTSDGQGDGEAQPADAQPDASADEETSDTAEEPAADDETSAEAEVAEAEPQLSLIHI